MLKINTDTKAGMFFATNLFYEMSADPKATKQAFARIIRAARPLLKPPVETKDE